MTNTGARQWTSWCALDITRGNQKSNFAVCVLKDLNIPQGVAAGEITVANQEELQYVHNRDEAATNPLEKGEAAKDNKH